MPVNIISIQLREVGFTSGLCRFCASSPRLKYEMPTFSLASAQNVPEQLSWCPTPTCLSVPLLIVLGLLAASGLCARTTECCLRTSCCRLGSSQSTARTWVSSLRRPWSLCILKHNVNFHPPLPGVWEKVMAISTHSPLEDSLE